MRSLTVHPHVCGERLKWRQHNDYSNGSSPRVWGTHEINIIRAYYDRFIPTCVGNASGSLLTCSAMPVHPHVCGERFNDGVKAINKNGSSPRVWGTLKC